MLPRSVILALTGPRDGVVWSPDEVQSVLCECEGFLAATAERPLGIVDHVEFAPGSRMPSRLYVRSRRFGRAHPLPVADVVGVVPAERKVVFRSGEVVSAPRGARVSS